MYTSVAPSRSNQEQFNQHRAECIHSYRYSFSLVSLPTVSFFLNSRLDFDSGADSPRSNNTALR